MQTAQRNVACNGGSDTRFIQALHLPKHVQVFSDACFKKVGDLSLEDEGPSLTYGLVFDQSLRADMDRLFFGA